MKRILLAVSLCVVAALNSFGATMPCPAGLNTLAALQALPAACQISASNNASLSWSLSNWSLSQASSIGFGSGGTVTPNANDILVQIQGVTNGFSVTFSDASNAQAGSNPFNFFAPVAVGGNSQQASWKTGYWVRSTSQNPDPSVTGIDTVSLSLTNPTGSGSFSVDKQFENFQGLNLNPTDAQVFYSNGSFILGTSNPSSPASVFNPRRTDGISIVDVVAFNSGQAGGGSLDAYVNTFTVNPAADVPEPLTFGLMGAGLAGIAALRLRKA